MSIKLLTEEEESSLYSDYLKGMKNKTHLGKLYGVSPRTVGRIIEKFNKQNTKNERLITWEKVFAILNNSSTPEKSKEPVEAPEIAEPVEAEEAPNQAGYVITSGSISLSINGHIQTINIKHPQFEAIKTLIKSGQFVKASLMMDIKKTIETYSQGDLRIVNGVVTYLGVPVVHTLSKKIVDLMMLGDTGFKSFANFMAKVMENPSMKTRERLMDFTVAEDIKISPDGDLVCYKNVKEDYKPSRAGMWERNTCGDWVYDSGAFYNNRVGQVLEMPRVQVDDEDSNTCSQGLHVMSLAYARDCWGTAGRTMVVHVNPADFVAIPTDYNNSKARVCKYTVVKELDKKELLNLINSL